MDILPAMEKVQIGDEAHRDTLQQQAWIGLMDQAMAALNSMRRFADKLAQPGEALPDGAAQFPEAYQCRDVRHRCLKN